MSHIPETGHTIALIVAAGRGSRSGAPAPKQYQPLAGKPLLRWSAERLLAHPAIAAVRVVIHPDDRALYDAATAGLPLAAPVAGGDTRQESVRRGLESIAAEGGASRVLIHDAARPLLSSALVERVLAALAVHAGAIPALPVVDTLVRGTDRVADAVARDGLWRVQTPQGFRFADILAAHRAATADHTDDGGVLRAAGGTVAIVPGDEDNMKVTLPEDWARADRLLAPRRVSRVGMGYDVHRFGPGDHVWLCGVKVPHDHALVGHSDADVALHALTDALLGAIGAGDIGQHFPPSDPQWRGADSVRFLAHAARLVADSGGAIEHLDVTIICERPKVGPHRDAMVARIAGVLGLAAGQVSVKATTTEGLGFTGRREGIAAQAIATVTIPV